MPNWYSCTKWSRDWSHQYILIRLLSRIDHNVKSDPSNLQTVLHNTLSTVKWQTILDHSRSQFRNPTNIGIHSLLTLLWVGTNYRRRQHAQRHLSASKKHSRPATNLAALSPMILHRIYSGLDSDQIVQLYIFICEDYNCTSGNYMHDRIISLRAYA